MRGLDHFITFGSLHPTSLDEGACYHQFLSPLGEVRKVKLALGAEGGREEMMNQGCMVTVGVTI